MKIAGKVLGIDFGTKKIGLALSNELRSVAFPYDVIPVSKGLVEQVADICRQEKINLIVVGESKNNDGLHNEVHERAVKFTVELKKVLDIEVVFQPEMFSTQEAIRTAPKDKDTDARAAAIILQSYLENYNL